MSEERLTVERPESQITQVPSRSQSTIPSESQKLCVYMTNVFDKIIESNKNVSVILTSKNGRFIKTNLSHQRALDKSACINDFSHKVRVLLEKIFPDESLENIRIKGKKNTEVFVTHDDQLEIIVIENCTGY